MSSSNRKLSGGEYDFCSHSTDRNNIFFLTDEEREGLRSAFCDLKYDDAGNDEYIDQIRQAAYVHIPQYIIHILVAQRAGLCRKPYLIFGNMPIEQVTGSPFKGEEVRTVKSSNLSENINIAFASILGEPYSISFGDPNEQIVNSLVPLKEDASHYKGTGSSMELGMHVDHAFLKHFNFGNISPDRFILQGVRHDPVAPKTHLADGKKILELLSARDRDVLSEKRFLLRPPVHWRQYLEFSEVIAPLLNGRIDNFDLSVSLYHDAVTPQDREAEDVFARFKSTAKEVAVWLDIRPGMLVCVDNREALHSRDAFQPTYDPNQRAMRWIQHTFIRDSLDNFRGFKREKHRVFNPSIHF